MNWYKPKEFGESDIIIVTDDDIKDFKENKYTLILEEYIRRLLANISQQVWSADSIEKVREMRAQKEVLQRVEEALTDFNLIEKQS